MILVVSVLLIVVIFLFVFFGVKNNISNRFFVVFLLTIVLYFFAHIYWVIYQDLRLSVILVNHFTPLYFLTGPALYFYVKSVISGTYVFNKTDLLHCIPFFIQLIAISEYIFYPFEEKMGLLQSLLNDPQSALEVKFNLFFKPTGNFVMRFSSLIIYIILSSRLLYLAQPFLKYYRITHRWLLSVLIGFSLLTFFYGVMISSYFYDPEKLSVIVNGVLAIITLSCLFIISLLPLFYPHILYGEASILLKGGTTTKKVNVESLPNKQLILLSKKIEDFFEKEKPYLERSFTLPKLAEKMGVPIYHIQKCFKQVHNTTFVNFKTAYKIQWVKEALFDPSFKNDTIDSVGMCAGFNSKSQFYISFKKHTGLTPKQYFIKHSSLKK